MKIFRTKRNYKSVFFVWVIACLLGGLFMAYRDDLTGDSGTVVTFLILSGLVVFFHIYALRGETKLEPKGLITIPAWLFTFTGQAQQFDLQNIQIINLKKAKEWQPVRRISGTRQIGFRVGLFELRNTALAYLYITDETNVLLLPSPTKTVLISLEKPEEFIAALKVTGR